MKSKIRTLDKFEKDLLIYLSVVVLLSIVFFVSYVVVENTLVKKKQVQENMKEEYIMNISNCLKKKDLDYDCSIILWSYGTISNCNKLLIQKDIDSCLFESANIRLDPNLCTKISENNKKSECLNKISKHFETYNRQGFLEGQNA